LSSRGMSSATQSVLPEPPPALLRLPHRMPPKTTIWEQPSIKHAVWPYREMSKVSSLPLPSPAPATSHGNTSHRKLTRVTNKNTQRVYLSPDEIKDIHRVDGIGAGCTADASKKKDALANRGLRVAAARADGSRGVQVLHPPRSKETTAHKCRW
jgi:hypothetical protein